MAERVDNGKETVHTDGCQVHDWCRAREVWADNVSKLQAGCTIMEKRSLSDYSSYQRLADHRHYQISNGQTEKKEVGAATKTSAREHRNTNQNVSTGSDQGCYRINYHKKHAMRLRKDAIVCRFTWSIRAVFQWNILYVHYWLILETKQSWCVILCC